MRARDILEATTRTVIVAITARWLVASSQLPLPATVLVAAAGWGLSFAADHEMLGQHQLDIVEADGGAPAVIATVALLPFARPTRRGRRDRILTY